MMKLLLFKSNFLLLILLALFACSSDDANPTSTNPPTTPPAAASLAIDYEVIGNFYLALTNTNILLEQKTDFGSQSNFAVSPTLPNGLSLDITNGNIKGIPTVASLPTPYIVTATKDSKTYTNIISLGVAPSRVWITNTNSANPYGLTAFVVGDGSKQTGISWSSSDESLATVNDGVVSFKSSITGGTVVISASKDSYSNGVFVTVPSTFIDYGVIRDFYIALINTNLLLEQKTDLGSQSNFAVSPTLPNGLSLDITNGNIKGTPTVASLPTPYIVTATKDSKTYTNIISLGVAPSRVWITNTNSANPYGLTAFVVGDGSKQTGISWSSSDESLATVNDGVVSFKSSTTGGTVVISASKDSYSKGVSFTVDKVEEVSGEKIITKGTEVSLIINSGIKILTTRQFKDKGLTSVEIPDSVTNIGSEAFQNNKLSSVVIPDSVKTIGNTAFYGNQLSSVVIPDSVTTIGRSTFENNLLTNLVIGTSVTTIGRYAFYSNKLSSVVIPDSIKIIGYTTFAANQLTNVVIGDSVITISDAAFAVNQLSSVVIPNSVITIGDSAFASNQLTNLVIGTSVKTIGDSAFENNQLSSVVIPNSVTTIGRGAFYNNKLSSVVIGDSVTIIDNWAFEANQLTNVVIGNSVTTIGTEAFSNNQLTSVVIPDSVVDISYGAFQNNQLARVVIPDSVTNIGEYAFTQNPNLVEVSLKKSLYTWITNTSSTNAIFGTQVTNYIRRL